MLLNSSFDKIDVKTQDRVTDLLTSTASQFFKQGMEALKQNDSEVMMYQKKREEIEKRKRMRDSMASTIMEEDEEDENEEGNLALSNSSNIIDAIKQNTARYGFLIFWLLKNLSASLQDDAKSTNTRSRTQSSLGAYGSKKATNSTHFNMITNNIVNCLDFIIKTFLTLSSPLIAQQSAPINRIFATSTERSEFIGMILQPCYQLMEIETFLKDTKGVRQDRLYRVLSLAVVKFNQIRNVQTSLDQLFVYFEHISEPLADLLFMLYNDYDNSTLAEEIIREICDRGFNSNDTKGPKMVAIFFLRLTQLAPKLVLKNFTYMIQMLGGENFTVRSSIVESAGIILIDLCKSINNMQKNDNPDALERINTDIQSLLDLVEERVLDVNPYTRLRAIQALANLVEQNLMFTKRLPQVTNIAVRSLQDKSSLVRKNALRLMSRLISTHPFRIYPEGMLKLSEWEANLERLKVELDNIQPPSTVTSMSNSFSENNNESASSEPINAAEESASNSETIEKLQLLYKYHVDAVNFIKKIHEGLDFAQKLLSSRSKPEVIESMDLFVLADAYKIETARTGIRAMIHLVSAKGGGYNDDALVIQKHLLSCYQTLFFESPANASPVEANTRVAKALITLTYNASVSELTSLEKLLEFAMNPSLLSKESPATAKSTRSKKNDEYDDDDLQGVANRKLSSNKMISDGVISILWKIFSSTDERVLKNQRRGAIIILSMLARSDPYIITSSSIEILLKIGFGEYGRNDFQVAKYSCIALERMIPQENKLSSGKSQAQSDRPKLAATHEVVRNIVGFILQPCSLSEWFSMCEAAMNTLNNICDNPDAIISQLIKMKAKHYFAGPAHRKEVEDEMLQQLVLPNTYFKNAEDNTNRAKINEEAGLLAQLIFIVGHAALKTLVHLEKMEGRFKRRKMELDKLRVEAAEKAKAEAQASGRSKRKSKGHGDDEEITAEQELELIGGSTTEDDFSEELHYVREFEILYSDKSLLAPFGPMIRDLCLEIVRDLQKVISLKEAAKRGENVETPKYNRFPRMLVIASTLSLVKMMTVSAKFCEENLGLLLTILDTTSKFEEPDVKKVLAKMHPKKTATQGDDGDQQGNNEQVREQLTPQDILLLEEYENYITGTIVRSNLIIGVGDLSVQFNHVMEENTEHVYERLRDKSRLVQRTTFLTMTFLILAGQVKVKDQQLLGQMARCLEDEDPKISNLVKIFFMELSTKDNTIYNNFIDIFNSLVEYTESSSSSSAAAAPKKNSKKKKISSSVDEEEDSSSFSEDEEEMEWEESELIDTSYSKKLKGVTSSSSSSHEKKLSPEAFRRIIKFIVSFVNKEKYIKQLSEKLSARLQKAESKEMWEHLAYVLSVLPHKNEEIAAIISQGYRKLKPDDDNDNGDDEEIEDDETEKDEKEKNTTRRRRSNDKKRRSKRIQKRSNKNDSEDESSSEEEDDDSSEEDDDNDDENVQLVESNEGNNKDEEEEEDIEAVEEEEDYDVQEIEPKINNISLEEQQQDDDDDDEDEVMTTSRRRKQHQRSSRRSRQS